MDRGYKIEYLPIAENDLTEIIDYIKIRSPKKALEYLDIFNEKISKLEQFPEIGKLPKDIRLKKLGYRILIIDNYLVFYVIKESVIEIRRILHGMRKYELLI
ncbi:MAG: type II toxin-antitoxin system RelE/ParE family toxin [Spirochaetes bacterium]|nr:type II toxin-antitoxin system RelE/ParE family toxin [Spirochaetota bacterium]